MKGYDLDLEDLLTDRKRKRESPQIALVTMNHPRELLP